MLYEDATSAFLKGHVQSSTKSEGIWNIEMKLKNRRDGDEIKLIHHLHLKIQEMVMILTINIYFIFINSFF